MSKASSIVIRNEIPRLLTVTAELIGLKGTQEMVSIPRVEIRVGLSPYSAKFHPSKIRSATAGGRNGVLVVDDSRGRLVTRSSGKFVLWCHEQARDDRNTRRGLSHDLM